MRSVFSKNTVRRDRSIQPDVYKKLSKLFLRSAPHMLMVSIVLGCDESSTPGECREVLKDNCICTMEYNPVCGCNIKTYGVVCSAGCYGITEFTTGCCGVWTRRSDSIQTAVNESLISSLSPDRSSAQRTLFRYTSIVEDAEPLNVRIK